LTKKIKNAMKRISTLLLAGLFFGFAHTQNDPEFTVEVSTDSLLMGNYLEVTFTLKNAGGQNFRPPTFDGFQVVGGPNQSTSMTIVNGEVSQSISYSYYIEPTDIGAFWIEPASIEAEGHILETTPTQILVVPNPDGIKQFPQKREQRRLFFDDFFNQMAPQFSPPPPAAEPKESPDKQPKKRKRKTIRI